MEMGMKFGKKPAVVDSRSLRFENYMAPNRITLPAEVHNAINHGKPVPQWNGYWNHHYGTCVPAMMCHTLQVWTWNKPPYVMLPDNDALTIYHDVAGFDLTTHQPDTGCSMVAANNYWRQTGIGQQKRKISGWMTLNQFSKDPYIIQSAIYQFGVVSIGLQIPTYVGTLWEKHEPWVNTTGTTIDGMYGHCVGIYGYDKDWLYFANVNRSVRMSYDFMWKYVDEMYTYTTPDWVALGMNAQFDKEFDHKPQIGFNFAAYYADLEKVTKGD